MKIGATMAKLGTMVAVALALGGCAIAGVCSNGCADDGPLVFNDTAGAGSTGSPSSTAGTGSMSSSSGVCAPVEIDAGAESTGCGPLPAKTCDAKTLSCAETACDGTCEGYAECQQTGWATVAYCGSDGSLVVIGASPDAGTCSPVTGIDTSKQTTGCDPTAIGPKTCPLDKLCAETACDGTCEGYAECQQTGWATVAYCGSDGSLVVIGQ